MACRDEVVLIITNRFIEHTSSIVQ